MSPTETTPASADDVFVSYYRCTPEISAFIRQVDSRATRGFFRAGANICFGRCSAGVTATFNDENTVLPDVLNRIITNDSGVHLPFDPDEIVENLRWERYVENCRFHRRRLTSSAPARAAYYLIRPLLPVAVRKHLQSASMSDWQRVPFPSWPMDDTVDRLMQLLLRLVLKAQGIAEIPFIWFWPDNYASCAMTTHDVETRAGRDFCAVLADLDGSRSIPCSFQLVPESRYALPDGFLQDLLDRGCEVNVHDLNHDGRLYRTYSEFKRRAARINMYGKQFGTRGFRSGGLYHNQEWYGELDFDYDMSVPNAGQLESQPGGCCTVMPYFVGNILELPVTTTQDYSLFHILNQYSTALWQGEIEQLLRANGLISFIVHPDYVIERRARQCYVALLDHLAALRDRHVLWIAAPKAVNSWWRARSQMQLQHTAGEWVIAGPQSERARVAYARLEDDHVAYRFVERESPNVAIT